MSQGLRDEFEVMLNVALGAEALRAYVLGFEASRGTESDQVITLWHLATVLPLVYHEVSRRAIGKRQVRSGLRAVLTRDPNNGIAQNEAVFNINGRIRASFPRTIRSLNCAFAWKLLSVESGAIVSLGSRKRQSMIGEAADIIRSAEKLGTWSGGMSAFEYFAVLGVEFDN